MAPIELFLWGCLGAVGIELFSAVRYLQEPPGRLPARYLNAAYWLSRLVLVLISGGLSVMIGARSVIGAVYVGAAAPLLFATLVVTSLEMRTKNDFSVRHSDVDADVSRVL